MNDIIKDIIALNENWDDPDYCLTRVKNRGWDLMNVRKQTPEICMAAVQQNGVALIFVMNQTPEICAAAIKQNKEACACVRLPVTEPEKTEFINRLNELLEDHETQEPKKQ